MVGVVEALPTLVVALIKALPAIAAGLAKAIFDVLRGLLVGVLRALGLDKKADKVAASYGDTPGSSRPALASRPSALRLGMSSQRRATLTTSSA